ncbi:hypothetical protein J4211_02495 [Candidatus Woesearchaeota archaeon]|nr:hypothetical protein [Candidatus Woesearchaeota archaeon]
MPDQAIVYCVAENGSRQYTVEIGPGFFVSGVSREQLPCVLAQFKYEKLQTIQKTAPKNATWKFEPLNAAELGNLEKEIEVCRCRKLP